MEKYNLASRLVVEIQRRWAAATGRHAPLAAAVASSRDASDRLREIAASQPGGGFNSAALTRRLEHFLVENQQVIPPAGQALLRGDAQGFGRFVDQSQRAAEELLGNQIAETAGLARLARQLGADAASGFGAGFGGSVWALVRREQVGPFLNAWQDRYAHEFPEPAGRAQFFATDAGPAAMQIC